MASQRKKLSFTVKVLIVLAAFAAVFFALALTSAIYSVNRTQDAIDGIGTVGYTAESREKIDRANAYYRALDTDLGLQKKITNAETLVQAKQKYASLMLWELHAQDTANTDGSMDAQVKQLIKDARGTVDAYFTAEEAEDIPNYHILTVAEAKYGGAGNGAQDGSGEEQGEDDIELC